MADWAPPEDATLVAAPPDGGWTPPKDAVLKKKESTTAAVSSEKPSPEVGSEEPSKPSEQDGKPINELQKQLEDARLRNIEDAKNITAVEIPHLTIPDTKLGQQKGLQQLAGDVLRKDWNTQADSLAFLAEQNAKLKQAIATVPKEKAITPTDQPTAITVKPTALEMKATDLAFKDQEATTKREEEAQPELGAISSAAGAFNQTVINTFTGVLKSLDIAASESIGRLGLGKSFGEATDPTQGPAYRLANWVEEQAKEIFPNNPKNQGDVLDTFSRVAGTLFSFMLGGAIGKSTKLAELAIPSTSKAVMQQTAEHIPAAFIASASTAAEEYDRSLKVTGNPETALRTWEQDMFTGLPFLVSPTFKAFNKATDGALKFGVKKFVEGGIAGGFQMGMNHAIENLSAQQTYDKTRSITDGILATGGSGFAINGALTGILAALTHKAIGASPAERVKYEQSIKYVEDQLKGTKEFGNTDFVIKAPSGDLGKPIAGIEDRFKGLSTSEVIAEQKETIKSSGDINAADQAAATIIEKVKSTPEEGVQDGGITGQREVSGQEFHGEEPIKATEQEVGGSKTSPSGMVQGAPPSDQTQEVNEAPIANQGGGVEGAGATTVSETPPQETLPPQEQLQSTVTEQTGQTSVAPIPEATAGAEPTVSINAEETKGRQKGETLLTSEGSKGEGLPNQPSPASGKPKASLEYITDEKVLKRPIKDTVTDEDGNIEPRDTTIGKKQADIKKRMKQLESLMDCLHG